MAGLGSMPSTRGPTVFLAILVAAAVVIGGYALLQLPNERRGVAAFDSDPSCHPTALLANGVGQCELAQGTVVGTPVRKDVKGGFVYLLQIQGQDGTITEARVSQNIGDAVLAGHLHIGRLYFHGEEIEYLCGAELETTLNHPHFAVSARIFTALFAAAIALLLSIPLALRIRYHWRT